MVPIYAAVMIITVIRRWESNHKEALGLDNIINHFSDNN